MSPTTRQTAIEFIGEFADREHADVLVARRDGPMPWSVSIEWGSEAPDSQMVGAAAYGIGDTLSEAVEGAARECGWLP